MLILLTTILNDDSLECRVCIQGMTVVYDLIEDGATEELIEHYLEFACEMFEEGEWKEQCKVFIDQEYEKLIKILEGEFPVETLCTLMSACEYPLPPINGACDACMVGFTFLEDLWSQDLGIELMEFVLEYVCYIFPEGKWRDECDKFMDQEYEVFIKWLDNEFPPQMICTLLDACEFPIDPIDDGICYFCEGAFTFLYDLFDFDLMNDDQIEAVLESLCGLFNEGPARQNCDKFIDQEYEELEKYIKAEFPPTAVCALVGACDVQPPVYDTECEFCRIFYRMTLDFISADFTVHDIEILLDSVCDVFQNEAQAQCVEFVNTYYEALIKALNEKWPANTACEAFNACPAQ
ncbi:Saposin [Hexamita inflata]|uniref:Saposin n=1 Tax=Hexamita inflata TaxID=28002 RepID=A0ABP1GJU0_9EUKA